MITESGANLCVLIITEPDKNWETFATWYSIYKNWPDAKVAIICNRNGQTPFESFQWTKRLKIPTIHRTPHKNTEPAADLLAAIKQAQVKNYAGGSILVIRSWMMAIDILSPKFLDLMNGRDQWCDRGVWYLKNKNMDELLEMFYMEDWREPQAIEPLWVEANDSDSLSCLVSYQKGCGRWIDTLKGCPFSSAIALTSESMTVNELRINNLWQKMTPLFNSVI